jgi:hypothetical protein
MHNLLATIIAAIFLASCSSTGDLARDTGGSGGSEEYEGSPSAAVAPVTDRGAVGRTPRSDRLHTEIQHSIQQQLDQSGIFAGVVNLERSDEGNEAEVIIEPTLVGPQSHTGSDLELRVRVSEKTKRRTVLDRTYEGSGGQARALNVAVRELEDDLADRYGR